MKKVIFTCITGGYEPVKEPQHINPDWDYVCFTDQEPPYPGTSWNVRTLQAPEDLSTVKKARWHKTHPFELFPDADIIIWIDGSFVIKGDLDEFVEKRSPESARISTVKHPQRKCIYEEQATVIKLRKDHSENTDQLNVYRKMGMPADYGLTETGILIYRKHQETILFCATWWKEIDNGSHRDQLSFDYVRWFMGIEINHFTARARSSTFILKKHPKKLLVDSKKPGMDIVYVLGSGSEWKDNEIRYSIRSFVKYFKDLRNVIIVGKMPVWAKNVIHIPWPDSPSLNADQRMIEKLIQACSDIRVSDRFLFCSDDKLLLDDCQESDFNGGHFGLIKEVENPSEWQLRVYATKAELKKRGLPYFDYNKPHSIQPIDKIEFMTIMGGWDWKSNSYVGCSLYQNSSKIFRGKPIRDTHLKIKKPSDHATIMEAMNGKLSMNYAAKALNDPIKETLEVLFPDKSIYEIYGAKGTAYDEYLTWLELNQPYDMGVNMIVKYTRNGRLIKYFQVKGENERTKKQLAKNLAIISRKWN